MMITLSSILSEVISHSMNLEDQKSEWVPDWYSCRDLPKCDAVQILFMLQCCDSLLGLCQPVFSSSVQNRTLAHEKTVAGDEEQPFKTVKI